MRIDFLKKLRVVFLLAAIAILAFCGVFINNSGHVKAHAAETNGTEIPLSRESIENNFDCYYTSDGATAALADAEEHFDFGSGVSYRGNSGFATLLFKDFMETNFELSADYTAAESPAKLVAKQSIAGLTEDNDGLAAYVTSGGLAVLKGFSDISGAYGTTKQLTGYNANNSHNIRLHVHGLKVEMYLDGSLTLEMRLPGFWEASIGYIGFQCGKKASFSSLTVRAFDYFGEEADAFPDVRQTRIACIGDSITVSAYGFDEEGYYTPKKTYPAVLQSDLGKNVKVINYGVSGIKLVDDGNSSGYTSQVEYAASLKFKPDIVLMMLGINDLLFSAWSNDYAQAYSDAYKNMISAYRSANENVSIYVLSATTYHGSVQIDNMIVNTLIPLQQLIAGQTGSSFIDMHTPTKTIPDKYIEDGLHPNAEGSAVLAHTVSAKLKTDFYAAPTIPSTLELAVGDEYSFTLKGKILPQFITTNSKVADVNSFGDMVANSAGKAVITASQGSYSARCVVTVKQKPQVTGVSYSGELHYGDELPQLTYVCQTDGTMRYKTAEALITGVHEYEWIFEPADLNTYIVVEGTIELDVKKAVPDAAAPTVADIAFQEGLKLKDITLADGYSWSNPEQSITVGTNSAKITYTPADTVNYATCDFDVSFKATSNSSDNNNNSGGCDSSAGHGSYALLCLLALSVGILKSKRKY